MGCDRPLTEAARSLCNYENRDSDSDRGNEGEVVVSS